MHLQRAHGWILTAGFAWTLLILAGCYAPLRSPGIPASTLPDDFRVPLRGNRWELNYATLTQVPPDEYILGKDDLVRIDISDITPFRDINALDGGNRNNPNAPQTPANSREMLIGPQGEVLLPLVGNVTIGGLTLREAQKKIVDTYANEFLDDPQVSVTLVTKATVGVMVVGGVANPGFFRLPKYENDIAHAIASAGGILEDQDEIQVHRRFPISPPRPSHGAGVNGRPQWNPQAVQPAAWTPHFAEGGRQADGQLPQLKEAGPTQEFSTEDLPATPRQVAPGQWVSPEPQDQPGYGLDVLQIPLRNCEPTLISPDQTVLHEGDVVVVKKFPDPIFFVVGQLSRQTQFGFNIGNRNLRDLGNGFLLPKDRDVDVVTAVAMAGYIDPIDSPTTVTVHRRNAAGEPMLIRVDLIAARYDRKESIMVLPGDIIYLNPDPAWWLRRTFDRIVPQLFTSPYSELMQRVIDPQGFN